jgi:hypothetical protein
MSFTGERIYIFEHKNLSYDRKYRAKVRVVGNSDALYY